MTRAAVLWTLLFLFALRVAGQLLVVLHGPRWLPPLEEWQSGLLPYPVLLMTQAAILVVFGIVATQFSRGPVTIGFFVRRNRSFGTGLWVFGWIYASAMVLRYIATMALQPEKRWSGDLIPVVFHIVLASFLLTVADHHRRSPEAGFDEGRRGPSDHDAR
jgi:uncharacterized protein